MSNETAGNYSARNREKKQCASVLGGEQVPESETRYSRCCEICSSENPRLRVFFNACGHIVCKACAVKRANGHGNQDCPFCRRATLFTTLIEEVVDDNELEENQQKNSNMLTMRCLGAKLFSLIYFVWLLISEETEEEKGANLMTNEDETSDGLAIRYSRRCTVCSSENPRIRAALVACGHFMCKSCAEGLTRKDGLVKCPTCEMTSEFKMLFEDQIVEKEDAKSVRFLNNSNKTVKQKRQLSRGMCVPHCHQRLIQRVQRDKGVTEPQKETSKNVFRGQEQHSPRLFEIRRQLETLVPSKIEALNEESRKFVKMVFNDAVDYYAIILEGGKPVEEEMKSSVVSGVEHYKVLSVGSKSNLHKQFPRFVHFLQSRTFWHLCNLIFKDSELVWKLFS